MTNTQKAVLVAITLIMSVTLLAVFGGEAQATAEPSIAEWSALECDQGNQDACTLEINLLLGN